MKVLGIFGIVVGMWVVYKKYGILDWECFVVFVVDFVENGFVVYEKLINNIVCYIL